MSTNDGSKNQIGEDPGSGLGSPPVVTSPTGSSPTGKPTISLTTLDKIKRFFFSKEEWEAYLIEKLEEQEKKKGGDITLETKSDSTTKKNVVSWLKTVFPSQEDANSFLKLQIDKMQEGQQSTPTSPQPVTVDGLNLPSSSSSIGVTKETEKASSSSTTTINKTVTRTDDKPL